MPHGGARLVVTNLPLTADSDDMTDIFRRFGNILSAQIITDEDGDSLGVAYIDFEDAQEAKDALLAYNGIPLDGKPMKLNIIKSSEVNVTKRREDYALEKINQQLTERFNLIRRKERRRAARSPSPDLYRDDTIIKIDERAQFQDGPYGVKTRRGRRRGNTMSKALGQLNRSNSSSPIRVDERYGRKGKRRLPREKPRETKFL